MSTQNHTPCEPHSNMEPFDNIKLSSDEVLLQELGELVIASSKEKPYEDYNTIPEAKDIIDNIILYIQQLKVVHKIKSIKKYDSQGRLTSVWSKVREVWSEIYMFIPLLFNYLHKTSEKIQERDLQLDGYFRFNIQFVAPVNVTKKGVYLNMMNSRVNELELFIDISTSGELSQLEKRIVDIVITYKKSLYTILQLYRDVHEYLLNNKATRIDHEFDENVSDLRKQRYKDMKIYFK